MTLCILSLGQFVHVWAFTISAVEVHPHSWRKEVLPLSLHNPITYDQLLLQQRALQSCWAARVHAKQETPHYATLRGRHTTWTGIENLLINYSGQYNWLTSVFTPSRYLSYYHSLKPITATPKQTLIGSHGGTRALQLRKEGIYRKQSLIQNLVNFTPLSLIFGMSYVIFCSLAPLIFGFRFVGMECA